MSTVVPTRKRLALVARVSTEEQQENGTSLTTRSSNGPVAPRERLECGARGQGHQPHVLVRSELPGWLLLAQGLSDLLPVHLGKRVAHDLGVAARLTGVLLFVLVQVGGQAG
jgi:hypothetical protein